jgi:nondiscriminating glutamyl-tRNA synthetase
MASPVRVRIAPSPTGNLHVGTARTALFNYLFAKHHQGQFVLRIEDTDLERSEAVYTQNILDSLHALGLQWDEGPDIGGPFGPYRQSERLAIYQAWAKQLLDAGKAYWCYLTPEELEAERELAKAEKRPYVYSGKCRDPKVREELSKDPNRKPSLRFWMPDDRGTITFRDAVRSEVSFDAKLSGDFVILKSNGTPSYNFAVVVDDILMGITHVIRGEDHIPNTPKQIVLFEAFNKPLPVFAHVGMILAADRTKLSKRHGATAVSEYIAGGYLPEAFCNFLALLGWSPPDGQERGTLAHFAQQFDLERIGQNPSIFDPTKLNWLNGLAIREMPLEELYQRVAPDLANHYDMQAYDHASWLTILGAVREPLTMLSEFAEAIRYFLGESVEIDSIVQTDVLTLPESQQVLAAFEAEFMATADFTNPESLAIALKAFVASQKPLKAKTVMWAIRAAVTGQTHGADLSTVLSLLGAQRVQRRVTQARQIQASVPTA